MLDRSNGKGLGVKLSKGEGGIGASIKSVETNGQAANFPAVVAGRKIVKVNGTDVTSMPLKEIGALIKASDQVEMTFEAGTNL